MGDVVITLKFSPKVADVLRELAQQEKTTLEAYCHDAVIVSALFDALRDEPKAEKFWF